jgi:hypothetical protein
LPELNEKRGGEAYKIRQPHKPTSIKVRVYGIEKDCLRGILLTTTLVAAGGSCRDQCSVLTNVYSPNHSSMETIAETRFARSLNVL